MKANIKNLCKVGFVIILLSFLGFKSKAADQNTAPEVVPTEQLEVALPR